MNFITSNRDFVYWHQRRACRQDRHSRRKTGKVWKWGSGANGALQGSRQPCCNSYLPSSLYLIDWCIGATILPMRNRHTHTGITERVQVLVKESHKGTSAVTVSGAFFPFSFTSVTNLCPTGSYPFAMCIFAYFFSAVVLTFNVTSVSVAWAAPKWCLCCTVYELFIPRIFTQSRGQFVPFSFIVSCTRYLETSNKQQQCFALLFVHLCWWYGDLQWVFVQFLSLQKRGTRRVHKCAHYLSANRWPVTLFAQCQSKCNCVYVLFIALFLVHWQLQTAVGARWRLTFNADR